MRKVLLSIVVFLAIGTLGAQTVTLTFTGRDAANHYVQLNKVVITNLTKSWQETIWWPDTVLQMQNGTGIDDYAENGGFTLSQNNPNPFSGTTDVTLTVVEEGDVNLDIAEVNGRIVETQNFASLHPGAHQFRISLSTVGTYVMTARQNGKTSSIKMICYGGGGSNTIDYLGMVQAITVVLKSSTNKPFNFGDMMEYVGYATIDGSGVESQHISQVQNTSQTFVLEFAVSSYQLPIVTTHAVTNITDNSATCGGTINSNGGATITARGVCWSATPNPTLSGMHTTDGSGSGSFTSNLTGLTPNITYYVQAYATNAAGTAYGQQEVFNTNPSLATVTTAQATNITTTSITLGGTVSSDGGSTVTERGVCWSANANPSLPGSYGGNPYAACGSGTGSFTYNVTYFTPGTTYYARAYAINTAGTAYGQQITFTALANLPEVSTRTVTDITATTASCGGNIISDGGGTVTARGVCWSTSPNPTISSSHTSDGSGTGNFTSSITGLTAGTTYYVRAYATNSAGTAYGQQMSFTPSAKPTVTTNTVSDIGCYNATCGGVVTSDNGSPVTARGVCWSYSPYPYIDSYTVIASNNYTTDGSGIGSFTSTITIPGLQPSIGGETLYVRAYATNSNGTSYGDQVSFVTPTRPSVITSFTISNITDTTATCSGTVTNDGGADVTERGICLSPSLDYIENICYYPFPSGNGTGSFTVDLTSLTPLNKYFVRAYATNCRGTRFGDTISFTTTGTFTCGTSTIEDYDGNAYSTVKIGSQCWMAQNLRTKHYADGTVISQTGQYDEDPISSYTTAYYYYQNGYKYNWKAATRYNESSNSNPSGIQGICPTGWHLPSKDEWQQMTDYLSDLGTYSCDNCRRCIGKALASSWDSGDTCIVAVNSTGFGGTRENNGCYWSSTLESDNTVQGFRISSFNSSTALFAGNRNAYSYVRCVSDESIGRSVTQRPYRANFSNNDWTLNNGNCSNYWAVGTPSDTSQPALYIKTNNNNEASYNINSSSTVMAEKIFVMPSDDSIHVEFDVQIGGETCYDYIKAFLAPVTVVFTPGNSHNTQSLVDYSDYAINFAAFKSQTTAGNSYPYVLNLTDGNPVHVSVNVANPAPDEQAKFVFLWRNNGSQGTVPGAIITNFSIGQRSCPGIPTVSDYDGNVYNTLKLGDQCWLRENMRTTCYSDGTPIPAGSTTSTTKGYRYAPDNDPNNVGKYGYLYNWIAAMHGAPSENEIPSAVQGVCPVGWHLPKLEEWNLLVDYLESQSSCYCDHYYEVAKSLAHQEGWSGGSNNLCGVCYNSNTNNASGLGILPSGYYDGEYNDFGSTADYWLPQRSTTTSYCLARRLNCNSTYLGSGNGSSQNSGADGKSVRCIHGAAAPTVTTLPFTVIDSTSAVFGGDVKSDGESPVIARGVCWSTSQKPTVSDSHTSDGNGLGVFNSTLLGLTPNTIYYVRAYATNAIGTTYGEQKSFKTEHLGEPCANATAVTDYDGNVYNILQIGAQCWMRENLRTTHYSDGTPIPYQLVNSTTSPYRYAPNNDQSLVQQYGYLYNTKAAMYNAPSSTSNPSGEQGICPTGWHLPSDSEWVQLINYLKTNQDYICSSSHYVAKSLASTSGWNSSSVNCSVGNYQEYNNATGFSAYPVGIQSGTTYHYAGQLTEFFTSHYQTGANNMGYIRKLEHDHTVLDWGYISHSEFASVRCLRDLESGPYSQVLPSIITVAVQDIDSCSAVCGGNISNNGSATVIERGVCWGLNHNPTTSDNHVANGNGIGSFSCNMTGLTYDMTFYARAYAVTTAGTVYGNEVSFYVPISDGIPCPGNPTVTDYDGNTYNTVHIGTQCWMKENLRTTHFANGISVDANKIRCPNNDSANVSTYGYLYAWDAVMHGAPSSTSGTQGVCPDGWHIPSLDEWTQLNNYLTSHSEYWCNGNSYNTAKAVAGTMGWYNNTIVDCTVGNDPSTNNATGFSALPAGYYNHNGTSISYQFGQNAYFSSSTQSGDSYKAFAFYLSAGLPDVNIISQHKSIPLSVRCIYNTVNTTAVGNITVSTAISGGVVSSNGSDSVTARGVCWSTSQNPTINDNHSNDGSGTGSFTSNLTGLTGGTTYYVRAYATTSSGTAYGNQVSFTTSFLCGSSSNVYDCDGNCYSTVQIGTQCWMAQNLRTKHYVDGTYISSLSSGTSATLPYHYEFSNSGIALSSLGYYYNWPAVMHSASSSTNNPSGVQGICPTGWHVPSDAEWTQLTSYLVNQSQYVCDFNYYSNTRIAKSLAATSGWETSSNYCAVGNNQSNNNLTGFNAVSAGWKSSTGTGFSSLGYSTNFWSCTQYDNDNAKYLSLSYDSPSVGQNYGDKGLGRSVRCIKD